MVLIKTLQPWMSGNAPVRLLDIGCGTAVEAEPLLATGLIAEFVGVDLDETAVSQAQSRLPQAAFVCTDAAALDDSHHYDIILIRRPDLLAQPAGWQPVFAKLPRLLELRYEAVADGVAVLGDIADIREMFIGFQEHLDAQGLRLAGLLARFSALHEEPRLLADA